MVVNIAAQTLKIEIDDYNRVQRAPLTDVPAFFQALDAFRNLQEFEKAIGISKYVDDVRIPLATCWQHTPRVVPKPVAIAFLESLVSIKDDPAEDSSCPICTEPYSKTAHERERHIAKRLPCGHVYCQRCLSEWFSICNDSYNNTCPYCWMQCFEAAPPERHGTGLQMRSDIGDYAISCRRKYGIHMKEKEPFLEIKISLVLALISSAFDQVEREIDVAEWKKQGKPATPSSLFGWAKPAPSTFDESCESEVPKLGTSDLKELYLRKAMLEYLQLQLWRRTIPEDDYERTELLAKLLSRVLKTVLIVRQTDARQGQ